MKLHGICLVRNEADVIAQTLTAAAAWADVVYVCDNGSTDGTWDLVRELGHELPQIVAWKQDARPYGPHLWAEAYERFRGNSSRGDWWCRLDADELYIDDPRDFRAAVPRLYRSVWSASFQDYFTTEDVRRWSEEPSRYAEATLVDERLRFYANNWSEQRFFRDAPGLVWTDGNWPAFVYDAVYPRRIRLKHFQYRSPEQIQRRLDTRRHAPAARFRHERHADWEAAVVRRRAAPAGTRAAAEMPGGWRERVVDPAGLLHDAGDGPYVVDEAALPSIPPLGRSVAASARRLVRARMAATRRSIADRPDPGGAPRSARSG